MSEDGPRFVPGAGVAVRADDGGILLVRRVVDGCWGCPGGHLEFGESFAECARREFIEETGFDVELTGLLGVYSEPRHSGLTDPIDLARASGLVQLIGVLFEGRLLTRVGSPTDDVSEVGWFLASALPSPLWEPDVPVIEDALSERARPFIR